VAIAAPLLCWLLDSQQRRLFGSYELGLELLLINGALTFAGLCLLSQAPDRASKRASSSARQRSA
jgi:hypothetical protein